MDVQDWIDIPEFMNSLLSRLFYQLRRDSVRQVSMGVPEYLAAQQIIGIEQFSGTPEALKVTLRLLWCGSLEDQAQFDQLWDKTVAQIFAEASARQDLDPSPGEDLPQPPDREGDWPVEQEEERLPFSQSDQPFEPLEAPATPQYQPSPVRAPTPAAQEWDALPDLTAYTPLSQRKMVYSWRYLRRPVANGPEDVLDLGATVEQVARQGFFLAPVYKRRVQNAARLVLFIDQKGSMVPFHRLCRDLVETVNFDNIFRVDHVQVCYFQNLLQSDIYTDPYLANPQAVGTVLEQLDAETSVLIVSDAGAARGFRRLERIQATLTFLLQLRRYTTLMAWLNPMPQYRWRGSSAEMIAGFVPMFPLNEKGFSQAIDIIRGVPLNPF